MERVLGTLARLRHLTPDMDPSFGLCFRGRLWDELTAAGVPVHDLGPVRMSRPWTVWRARRRLRRVLAGGYDVVVCHSCWPYAVFAPVARAAGARLFAWIHESLTGGWWVERWAGRTPPDGVLTISHFTARSMGTVFPGVPVAVLYNPVEPPPPGDPAETRQAVRAELGAAADAVVVLMLARLDRIKGHPELMAALGRLTATPGWECWVGGSPQRPEEYAYLAELRAAADRDGTADRVRFIGHRSDPHRVMAAADVYCQPNSGPEGFGLTFVEALAAGLPVVTTDIGSAPELLADGVGVLVPAGDPAALAAALDRLIRDPAERRRFAAGGPRRAVDLCDPAVRVPELARHLAGRRGE
jgi:glycosyltransferase involved in cell wall biosynthesis